VTVHKGGFAEQVRDRLRHLDRQRAALEAVQEIDAEVGVHPSYADDRRRGGVILDPVDPTMVVAPVEWFAALLAHAEYRGRRGLTQSPAFVSLVSMWNDEFHDDEDEINRLRQGWPDLANALVKFMDAL